MSRPDFYLAIWLVFNINNVRLKTWGFVSIRFMIHVVEFDFVSVSCASINLCDLVACFVFDYLSV